MQRPILCNGAIFRVTTNLLTALRKLRDHIRNPGALQVSRFVWVDAVCINQSDTAERRAQVSMMDVIYSQARTVFAWLGMSDRQTGKAIESITHLSRFRDSDHDGSKVWTLEQKGVSASGARAIMGFFMREWFNRVWVVQEVVLASRLKLLCGDYLLDWDVLVRCSQLLMSSISPTDFIRHVPAFLTREQLRDTEIMKRPGLDIWGLQYIKNQLEEEDLDLATMVSMVYMGRARDASDPRDRFFAMLGILKRHRKIRSDGSLGGHIPAADYSKSVAQVFADCAILVLRLSED